jgi:hypothetical protein
VLRGFHASVLGIALGPVDTVFTATGLLAVAGGLYARTNLRDLIREGTTHEANATEART